MNTGIKFKNVSQSGTKEFTSRASLQIKSFSSLSILCFMSLIPTGLATSLPSTKNLHSISNAVVNTTCSPVITEGRSPSFVIDAVLIPLIVLLSGVCAGLTLGYMSLDNTQLQVLAKTGTAKQRIQATRILPILANRHLLLVTLLITNMLLNETLPIISEGVLGGGIQSVVVSTVLVIIFAEIIPQSICTTYGLAIGSTMVWPVQILIWVFFVISWPVAWLLNRILGPHNGIVYRRTELKELINLHGEVNGHGGDLARDTITIVGSALDFQAKLVYHAMTPIENVFMLPIESKLDYETLERIGKSGHSRIPVYETSEIGTKRVVSVLLTKQLLLVDPEDCLPLHLIPMNNLPIVAEDLPLPQLLNTFQLGQSHLAIVCRKKPGFGDSSVQLEDIEEKDEAISPSSLLRSLFKRRKSDDEKSYEELEEARNRIRDEKVKQTEKEFLDARASRSSLSALYLDADYPIGLITLEDLIEEILGEEIYDETDVVDFKPAAVKHYVPPEYGVLEKPKSTKSKKTGSFNPPSTPPIGFSRFSITRARSSPGSGRARVEPEAVEGTEKIEKSSTPAIVFAPIMITSPSQESEVRDNVTPLPSPAILPPNAKPILSKILLNESDLISRGRQAVFAAGIDPETVNLRLGVRAPPRGNTPTGGSRSFKSPAVAQIPIKLEKPPPTTEKEEVK